MIQRTAEASTHASGVADFTRGLAPIAAPVRPALQQTRNEPFDQPRDVVVAHVVLAGWCCAIQQTWRRVKCQVWRVAEHEHLVRRVRLHLGCGVDGGARRPWHRNAWQARGLRESRSRFTAGTLGERQQDVSRLFRPEAVARLKSCESFCKDFPRASGFVADKRAAATKTPRRQAVPSLAP